MKNKGTQGTKYNTVLLIDEDQIDNFINERIITSSSFAENVVVKTSGVDALAFLRDSLKNNKTLPELIFLDLNMPMMDGFGFLEEYHKLVESNPELEEKTKVIVLSSSISPSDIDKSAANPYVQKYLNKPLTEKYLNAIYF